MLHGAGIFTKLGHFWGFYVGKYSSTMVRIWATELPFFPFFQDHGPARDAEPLPRASGDAAPPPRFRRRRGVLPYGAGGAAADFGGFVAWKGCELGKLACKISHMLHVWYIMVYLPTFALKITQM